jgi:hypothetical protein
MTDRELLEKAAKAAGFQWNSTVQHEDGSLHGCFLDADYQEAWPWNPLTDDGDALRLTVKLGMHIRFYRKHVDVDAEAFSLVNSIVSESFTGARKGEATRRAIVRAAAALSPEATDPPA